MTILKIIEELQSYGEDFLTYKLDGGFANAVTEAISLLIGQGEQIADLQNELREAREAQRWIPVTERLPDIGDRCLCNVKSFAFPGSFYQTILKYDKFGFIEGCIYTDDVTHWMPIPDFPNDKIDYEAR